MKKLISSLIPLVLCIVFAGPASAGGRIFKEHAAPYTFLFGNDFDTHQETRLTNKGNLKGFLYIRFTGGFDEASRSPIAEHCNHSTDPADCTAGWLIKAKPCIPEYNNCSAAFMYHFQDHPYWLIGDSTTLDAAGNGFVDEDALSEGSVKGMRNMLPQPFAVSHIHWLTDGTFEGPDGASSVGQIEEVLSLDPVTINVPAQCNVSMAGDLAPPGVICPGYIFSLTAVKRFAFRHGGELIPVRPGIDIASHHNIVSSYAPVNIVSGPR
jgi:hypothetical protein